MRTEYSQQNLKPRVPPLSFPKEQTVGATEIRRNYSFLEPAPQVDNQVWKEQVIVAPYRISSELIRVSEQSPFSFKSKAMDVILCCLYIDANLVVAGSKDGSLLFYDRNGNVIKAHNNIHKSPVCTLSLVNNGRQLASGSDHPNPEIILWDLNSVDFPPFCKLREHKGAVTAIECLRDG